MIRESNDRRKEMEASQNQNQLGESVNSLNDVIAHIQTQIYEANKTIISLTKEVS
jgi:maltodextrin utilization protein YvdJ